MGKLGIWTLKWIDIIYIDDRCTSIPIINTFVLRLEALVTTIQRTNECILHVALGYSRKIDVVRLKSGRIN